MNVLTSELKGMGKSDLQHLRGSRVKWGAQRKVSYKNSFECCTYDPHQTSFTCVQTEPGRLLA